MAVIQSKINRNSDEFAENSTTMLAQVDELKATLE